MSHFQLIKYPLRHSLGEDRCPWLGLVLNKQNIKHFYQQMRLLKNQQVVALVTRYEQKFTQVKELLATKIQRTALLSKQLDQLQSRDFKVSPDVSTCQGFQIKMSRQRKVSRKLSNDRNFCIQCESTLRQNQELKCELTQLQNRQQQYAEYQQIKERHKEMLKEAICALREQEVKHEQLSQQKQKRTEIKTAFAGLVSELVCNRLPAKTAEIALAAGRVSGLPKELQTILLKKVQQLY